MSSAPIRILGLDPGLRRTGWGIIESDGVRLSYVASGVITSDGVSEVSTDPDGEKFPWRPQLFQEILPEHYIASDKSTLCPMSDLDNKYLMLYFS